MHYYCYLQSFHLVWLTWHWFPPHCTQHALLWCEPKWSSPNLEDQTTTPPGEKKIYIFCQTTKCHQAKWERRCAHLEFGSFVLIQFSLQQLLSHLYFGLEAIWILIGLIGFEWILVRSWSVRPDRAGLPLFSEHNSVPEFQPLQQTAVGKLQRNSHTD